MKNTVRMCSKCGERPAIVFLSRFTNAGESINEGFCLNCARELGMPQIDEIIRHFGISDADIDAMSQGVGEVFDMFEENKPENDESSEDDSSDFTDSINRTATFPFLDKLFRNVNENEQKTNTQEKAEPKTGKNKRRTALDTYCINLSERAREGKLDMVIGREEETEHVVQILNRRQKNNPCLIGEPGVGKTAIAEGLAQRISCGNVPFKLQGKEVYLLDLTALVAGTQYRGQFEARMKALVQEIRNAGNIILVIDEIHTIVGAGSSEGSMNAANILKPALARGEVQVIGATTFNEYRKYIEKDTALERRFQPVTVNEPNEEDTLRILKGIAHYYEEFHGVTITEPVLVQAVRMSERYITDRFLPDKAIDLIDEACSDLSMHDETINRRLLLRHELDELNAHTAQDPDLARIDEDCANELLKEYNAVCEEPNPMLSVDNLANVIERWTKIPASRIRENEVKRLSDLDKRLKSHIVGQDEAIDAVCAAIRRNRIGISPKRKPVSFIFVGPTGVGKTELVKQLAQELFTTPDSLIRLDMSEFMEKHSVSRIIGAPPGYLGYDEAGQLTEKIRRHPYSIILFDEIEKAHPDVLNILLQILDDGEVTDAHGRKVNFENTVIIMTSNAGSERKSAALGFDMTVNDQAKENAMRGLREFMRPELINRVDEIVCFNQLEEDNFKGIASLMLDELKNSLAEKGYQFAFSDAVVEYLVRKSFSTVYGARNLRRTIQKEVEDQMAVAIINSYDNPVSVLAADMDDDTVVLTAN